ncbi:MAG: YceI family protein [Candidatus Dormiibacterota bacterium]
MAGAVAVVATVAGGAAYGLIAVTRPQPLGLPSPRAVTPAATPSPNDLLFAACSQPGTPPASTPNPAGMWVVQPGSQAGYRAREKFDRLPSPNVAVARTDRVGGWLLVDADAGSVTITSGCVAVELATLHSIDQLPGLHTADRDQAVRDFLNTNLHPFAVFTVNAARLTSTSPGTPIHVRVTGGLELNGLDGPAAFDLVARLDGNQLSAAGSTSVQVKNYGIDVPEGAEGFVSVDPHITLEVSLVLTKQ